MSDITFAKDAKRIRVPLSLMHQIRDQLSAMNESVAHAASWIRPKSHATGYLIDAIDAAISLEIDKTFRGGSI